VGSALILSSRNSGENPKRFNVKRCKETLLEVCKILLNSLPDKNLPLYVVNFLPRSLEAGENDFYYPGDFSIRNGVLNRKNSNS